jgi:NAD-dependent DNA ligase
MTFEEYKALSKEIDYHMNLYYNDDAPEISDYEYDMLMQKLKAVFNATRFKIPRDISKIAVVLFTS